MLTLVIPGTPGPTAAPGTPRAGTLSPSQPTLSPTPVRTPPVR
jgi:hypothetical protein